MVIVRDLFPPKNALFGFVFFHFITSSSFLWWFDVSLILMGFDAFDVVGPYIELDLFKNDDLLICTMVNHH